MSPIILCKTTRKLPTFIFIIIFLIVFIKYYSQYYKTYSYLLHKMSGIIHSFSIQRIDNYFNIILLFLCYLYHIIFFCFCFLKISQSLDIDFRYNEIHYNEYPFSAQLVRYIKVRLYVILSSHGFLVANKEYKKK